VDLGDPVGSEQAFMRPLLILSPESFAAAAQLVTALPITTAKKPYPTRVELDGTLDETSYVQVEQIRTLSTRRLIRYVTDIAPVDLAAVDDTLTLFLQLDPVY
jgi:mRNA interferase MazF